MDRHGLERTAGKLWIYVVWKVLQGSCGYTWIGSYCREVVDRHGLESTAGKDVV